jgi:hypothetical protein
MAILLDTPFKGDRTYVHGTSFFSALEAVAKQYTTAEGAYVSRLIFRRFACTLCTLTEREPRSNALIGSGTYRLSDGSERLFWLGATEQPVCRRVPFDETALLTGAELDLAQKRAWLPCRTSYAPIEEVVVLTKLLNYKTMPEVSGKWVFGQLDLTEPLNDAYRRLDIHMKASIPGRFSVNDIVLDDRTIGTVRFIVAKP